MTFRKIFPLILAGLMATNASALDSASVKTGKDGLGLVSRSGFGDQNLARIKQQYLSGANVNRKIAFAGKSYDSDPHFLTVESTPRELTVIYAVSGTNYGILRDGQRQQTIAEQKKDGVYSTHFNITLMDVARRAVEMGLEDKTGYASKVGELSWKWNEAGYRCELSASINSYQGGNRLSYACTYRR